MTPLRALGQRAPFSLALRSPRLSPSPTTISASRVLAATARPLTTTSAMATDKPDWSANQYLKFGNERTRAVHDLVNRIPLPGGLFPVDDATASLRIVDLGCGPGNSTAVLATRFPGAAVSGVDSSPDMVATAKKTLPGVPFALGDLRTYDPTAGKDKDKGGGPHLVLANAVFHWLSLEERLATILRLFAALPPGGVLALQMPDNKQERTHRAIEEVARGVSAPADAPWVPILRDLHDRDDIETVEQMYDALVPHSASVDVWHSVYNHVMRRGTADIVEWMKGTALQPWLHALHDDASRQAFLQAYETRLAELYETRVDGTILIHYPRLFVVAVKK